MSTEILRRAAALMREQAEAARDVTGSSDWFAELAWTDEGPGWACYSVNSSGGRVSSLSAEEEAEHIASWNPTVALAVADWLSNEADLHVVLTANGARGLDDNSDSVKVARAYLGETA
jgi:hypothetical protein